MKVHFDTQNELIPSKELYKILGRKQIAIALAGLLSAKRDDCVPGVTADHAIDPPEKMARVWC